MRRMLIAATLAAGCFEEPGPDDHIIASATTPITTAEPEESSSSDGESSSGESSSSSGEEPFDPHVCPQWCSNGNGCDVQSVYILCRCHTDIDCQQDTTCKGFSEEPYMVGHCQ